jgi:hypothetical protein
MKRSHNILIAIVALAIPLSAEGPAEKLAQVTSTQHFDFAPGGTLRLNDSYGDLYIEGWDQSQVEVTVTKSTSYSDNPAELKDKLTPKLDTIKVAAERRSDTEVVVTTTWATRADWAPPLPKKKQNGVHLEYRIFVPRNTRLIVDHHGGSVEVGNLIGDIEAANRDGDILLMMPGSGTYSIEARSKMGHIASEFEGTTLSRYLVGQKFTSTRSGAGSRLHLRTGFGGITILALPPEGEALSKAGSQ